MIEQKVSACVPVFHLAVDGVKQKHTPLRIYFPFPRGKPLSSLTGWGGLQLISIHFCKRREKKLFPKTQKMYNQGRGKRIFSPNCAWSYETAVGAGEKMKFYQKSVGAYRWEIFSYSKLPPHKKLTLYIWKLLRGLPQVAHTFPCVYWVPIFCRTKVSSGNCEEKPKPEKERPEQHNKK